MTQNHIVHHDPTHIDVRKVFPLDTRISQQSIDAGEIDCHTLNNLKVK